MKQLVRELNGLRKAGGDLRKMFKCLVAVPYPLGYDPASTAAVY